MATTEKAVASYAVYAGLRDERKKTDSSVAKILGFGPSTLSDWKAGRYIPKHDKIAAIADLFDVPVEVFYQGETTNEIAIREEPQLPETIEDLTQFVLVGKAKLNAYMLKLQTVNRLSTAQEIRDQTLREAQEISTALIAAEQKIGELLLRIPKKTGNQYTSANSTRVEKAKVAEEMGYSKDDVSDYQRMAQNPDVVQKVIDEAMERGEVVTKASVMREIKFYKDRIATLEKQKTQTVEVVPDDYKEVKSKAKAYDAESKQLNDKLRESYKKQRELEDEVRELKALTNEDLQNRNLNENVYYFCAMANNFVGNVGGLVWLTERIADMPKKQRDLFMKAANALRDFSVVFAQNLERGLNGEQQSRTDTGVSLLTDSGEHGEDFEP